MIARKHEYALMRVRYTVLGSWSDWRYEIVSKQHVVYQNRRSSQGSAPITKTEISEWETICDDQPITVLRAMHALQTTQPEKGTNDVHA